MKLGTYMGLMLQLCLLGVMWPLYIYGFPIIMKNMKKFLFFSILDQNLYTAALIRMEFFMKCIKYPRCAFLGFKGFYKYGILNFGKK